MAPAAVATPTPASRPDTPTKAPKTANAAMKVDTSKLAATVELASAASSTLASSTYSASALSRTSSTFSDVSIAPSITSVSSEFKSMDFEHIHIETALHKVAEKLTVDTQTGELIAIGVLVHGKPTSIRFDLAKYLGNKDSELVWNSGAYHKSSQDIKIVTEHDSCYLVAKCKHKEAERYDSSRFNLGEVLYIIHGKFELRSNYSGLSRTLSEVPWMKFKIVAEPDYAVFAHDPVVRAMMTRIADSTVHFVTAEMSQRIQAAVESATKVVMESAMLYVAEEMQAIVQGVSVVGKPQRSSTALGNLNII